MCFFCGAKKMLALQRTRLHAVFNRLERSRDSLAMIREKRSSVFSLVQGPGCSIQRCQGFMQRTIPLGLAAATSQLDQVVWKRAVTDKFGSKQTWRHIFSI